jgi:hypothetical protein
MAWSSKRTAAPLIAAAVLFSAAFAVLGAVFDYPDIPGEPVEDILAALGAAVVGWFTVLALSAALFAPIAVGVGNLSTHRAMRIAVPVGIAAAAVQVIGLARWPRLVPRFAADAASSDPAVAAAARDAFVLAPRILGTRRRGNVRLPADRCLDAAGPAGSRSIARPALAHRRLETTQVGHPG